MFTLDTSSSLDVSALTGTDSALPLVPTPASTALSV